jgi:dimethylhistidine N-methyltransferase
MQAINPARSRPLAFYQYPVQTEHSTRELLAGLRQGPKRIHPKFFYDERGSALFDRITTLPEYYPTRAEKEVLRRHAPAIAAQLGPECVLIEPGSGSSEKVELLLEALRPRAYIPMDIAAEQVRSAGLRLAGRFPWLACHAIAADFSHTFALPEQLPPGRRVIFYPGSSIGNFEPGAAQQFLRQLKAMVRPGGGLLIGVDLQKDIAILQRAYNDRQGVTAAFNLNVLRHINRLTGSRFALDGFAHVAFYNSDEQRIEMHLQSRHQQEVVIGGERIQFRAGEHIVTEYSYKYTAESFTALAAQAGFRRRQIWLDEQNLFSVHFLVAEAEPAAC